MNRNEQNDEIILKCISENPGITIIGIQKKIGLEIKTVYNRLTLLMMNDQISFMYNKEQGGYKVKTSGKLQPTDKKLSEYKKLNCWNCGRAFGLVSVSQDELISVNDIDNLLQNHAVIFYCDPCTITLSRKEASK